MSLGVHAGTVGVTWSTCAWGFSKIEEKRMVTKLPTSQNRGSPANTVSTGARLLWGLQKIQVMETRVWRPRVVVLWKWCLKAKTLGLGCWILGVVTSLRKERNSYNISFLVILRNLLTWGVWVIHRVSDIAKLRRWLDDGGLLSIQIEVRARGRKARCETVLGAFFEP